MEATTDDPLKGLIAENTDGINRQRLTDQLKPYTVFSSEGELTLLSAFYSLNNQSKILIILVAQKARHLLFDDVAESMSPSEIIAFDVMAEGSVKSTLKRLLEKTHDVKKDASKRYYVPNYLLAGLDSKIGTDE